MLDDTKLIEQIGKQVNAELGDCPTRERLDSQRRAWMAHVATSRVQSSRPARIAFATIAAAAAAALLFVLLHSFFAAPRDAAPIAFWVGDQVEAGSAGRWIHADETVPVPIRFDNGSRMKVNAGGAARIVSSTVEKVDVNLSNGTLLADIKRTADTSWQVNAGPYTVTVLGTEFSVDWDTETASLGVSVLRGKVLVQGGNLNEHGIRLMAGKRLSANGLDGSVAVEPIEEAREEIATAIEETQDQPAPAPTPSLDAAGPPPPAVARHPSAVADKTDDRWKELCLARDYGGAIDAAQEHGIDHLVETLDREDLWRLGNAARYARRPEVSKKAYLAVRDRFTGSGRAAAAAFMLGRIHLDELRDPAGSTEWFERYLEEAPFGPLAEEALGRLIDACDKAGHDREAARRSREYLSRYPDGSYSRLARSILPD